MSIQSVAICNLHTRTLTFSVKLQSAFSIEMTYKTECVHECLVTVTEASDELVLKDRDRVCVIYMVTGYISMVLLIIILLYGGGGGGSPPF